MPEDWEETQENKYVEQVKRVHAKLVDAKLTEDPTVALKCAVDIVAQVAADSRQRRIDARMKGR